jgi:hypothetical protein
MLFHDKASFNVYCLVISMETFTLLSLLVFILSILNFIKIILHNELMLVSTNERLMSLDHPVYVMRTGF